ncbi:MAG: ATP-binding protein [Acidimicrobiia bacterium]|nr:ATP-binding protein [Acidimicrobiia bacterium]
MEDLSLHILDILENSVTADATEISVVISEDSTADRLTLEIVDNGNGMDEAMKSKALDPFFTTRTTRRIGLGLPLLAQAARESGGGLELDSERGRGTRVLASFRLSHPDRKPLGDLTATLGAILAGRPELELRFEHRRDGETLSSLDTRQPTPTVRE